MDLGLRRAGLDELDEAGIERLAAAQESLFVERKGEIPTEGLGPSVSAFANTLGGWLILGVGDKGEVPGFESPGRADLQDYVREKLKNEVDPMPAFTARMDDFKGKKIGLIRVAESADTPHVTAKGIIYVRVPGAKKPLTDHRELIELARRGEMADVAARARLLRTDLMEVALATPDELPGDRPDSRAHAVFESIVRASPLTVSGNFAINALSPSAPDHAKEWSESLFPVRGGPPRRYSGRVLPMARGLSADSAAFGQFELATFAVDAGGVVAARLASRNPGGALLLSALKEDRIAPLLANDLAALEQFGANGRCAVSLELRGARGIHFHHEQGTSTLESDSFWASGYAYVPAEQQAVDELAESWTRELGRALGFPLWEG